MYLGSVSGLDAVRLMIVPLVHTRASG